MGKAIVAMFFVLGFGIFSFIKFASKGVRAAYKAVNEEPGSSRQMMQAPVHDDKLKMMCDLLVRLLSIQRVMISSPDDRLFENADDDWSLGYVYGFSDAMMQKFGYGPNDETIRIEVMIAVFRLMFGEEQGDKYLPLLVKSKNEGNPHVTEGMKQGGEDVFAWFRDEKNAPLGWSGHVHGTS